MKTVYALTIVVVAFFICCYDARSEPVPQPQLLSTSVQRAKVVILSRLNRFIPDKSYIGEPELSSVQQVIALSNSYPSGEYELSPLKVLKGDYSNLRKLDIYLPAIAAYYYGGKVDLPVNSEVLLILDENSEHQLVPVDKTLPLIPLGLVGSPSSLVKANNPPDVENEVVSMIASTFKEPLLRKVNIHLVRSVVNYQLPPKLTPFEEDIDEDLRDDVLYCLVINQQVKAIPLLAQLSETRLKQTGGAASVGAFQQLKTKEAVPYLNPLLLNVAPSTRQSTAFALRKLADRTSLPYLFKALELPDPQGITLYEEYATLHRLLSRLGTTKSLPVFLDQREAILKATLLWWTKHQQEFMPEAASAPSKT